MLFWTTLFAVIVNLRFVHECDAVKDGNNYIEKRHKSADWLLNTYTKQDPTIKNFYNDFMVEYRRIRDRQHRQARGKQVIEMKLLERKYESDNKFMSSYYLEVVGGGERYCRQQASSIADKLTQPFQDQFENTMRRHQNLYQSYLFFMYLNSGRGANFADAQERAQGLFEQAKEILLKNLHKLPLVDEYRKEISDKVASVQLHKWVFQDISRILENFVVFFKGCLNRTLNEFDNEREHCYEWAFNENITPRAGITRQAGSLWKKTLYTIDQDFLTEGPFYRNSFYRPSLNTIVIYPIFYFDVERANDGGELMGYFGHVLLHELAHVVFTTSKWMEQKTINCIAQQTDKGCSLWLKNRNCNNGHSTSIEDFSDWLADELAQQILKEDYPDSKAFEEELGIYYSSKIESSCEPRTQGNGQADRTHSPTVTRVNSVVSRLINFQKRCGGKPDRCIQL